MFDNLNLIKSINNSLKSSILLHGRYKEFDNIYSAYVNMLELLKTDNIDKKELKLFYKDSIYELQEFVIKIEDEIIPILITNNQYVDIHCVTEVLKKIDETLLFLENKLNDLYRYHNEKIIILAEKDQLDDIVISELKELKVIDEFKHGSLMHYICHEYNVITTYDMSNLPFTNEFNKLIVTSDFYKNNSQQINEMLKFKKMIML